MSVIHICSVPVTVTNHFITLYNLFKAQLEKNLYTVTAESTF